MSVTPALFLCLFNLRTVDDITVNSGQLKHGVLFFCCCKH